MADQLCTTAQVKALLGIAAIDTTDDVVISELIDEVSSWIQGYTGRKLVPDNAATYVFDTQSGYGLRIPRGIRAITSLGVATTHQPDTGGTYTTVPTADIHLRPQAQDNAEGWPFMEVRISRGTLAGTIRYFGTWENGAKITGDFGFAATPPDIAAVAIDGVVAAKQSLSDGASSVIGADALAISPWKDFFGIGSPQRKVLDSYRYWHLA
jgi:hypothetical protein